MPPKQGTPKIIAALGTSITFRTGSLGYITTAQTVLAASVTTYIYNHAVGSSVIYPDGTNSDMATQIAAAESDEPNIIIVELGTNDLEASPIQATYEAQLAILKANHPRATIYCMGILPKTLEPGVNWRTAHNVAIAAAATTAGATYWDTNDWINPATDCYDGIHLTEAAATAVGTIVAGLLLA